MSHNCYMATVVISVAPDQWTYQGITWQIEHDQLYFMDLRLCFDLKCAPYLFTQISDFIVATMSRLGIKHVTNFLDDFLVFGDTFQECQEAQATVITLLGQLGFNVAWKKCSSPSQMTKYLGIIFDSLSMRLSLPQEKLDKLSIELNFFQGRNRV